MSKKRLIIVVALVAVVVLGTAWYFIGGPMPPVGPWRYVASQTSDRYHNPSCVWATHIRPDKRVFYWTSSAAEKDERNPCPVCISE